MTRRGDDKAWGDFVAWCAKRGLKAVPANPWTLAAYARWCEPRRPYAAIAKAIRAISRVHNTKSRARPERHPLVQRTLRTIEVKAKTKARKRETRKALFRPEDFLASNDAAPAAEGQSVKAQPVKTQPAKRRQGLSAQPKLVSRRKLKK